MRVFMILMTSWLLLGCGPRRPVPVEEDSASNESSSRGSSFYPTGNQQNGSSSCIGSSCTTPLNQTIGSAPRFSALIAHYQYSEGELNAMIRPAGTQQWIPLQISPMPQSIPDICKEDGSTALQLKFVSERSGDIPAGDKSCVVGHRHRAQITVGVDVQCSGSGAEGDYANLNDDIITFKCEDPQHNFAFDQLFIDPRIPLNQWIRGDNDSIF